jgi:hypothetical protein
MKGLIARYAQGMAPKKGQPALESRIYDDITPGTRTVLAPFTGWLDAFGWGAGASGSCGGTACGNSGAAGYTRQRVTRGQPITYTVGTKGAAATATNPGNAGTASSVTINGRTGTSNGGPVSTASAVAAAATATGWDYNRTGGLGALVGGVDGTSGEAGGASGNDLGGGAPGFTDLPRALRGGDGGLGSAGVPLAGAEPGGGGGANTGGTAVSGTGGAGRVVLIFTRALL